MSAEKVCMVCGRSFQAYEKTWSGPTRFIGKRPHYALTCSKKCSKVFQRNRKDYPATDRKS